jgi:hypothetical protein
MQNRSDYNAVPLYEEELLCMRLIWVELPGLQQDLEHHYADEHEQHYYHSTLVLIHFLQGPKECLVQLHRLQLKVVGLRRKSIIILYLVDE